MTSKQLLAPILNDEAVTRGLADPEARVLIEWLVEQAEELAEETCTDEAAAEVQRLCLRARAIGRFVKLWCHDNAPGPACQLAATQQFRWPLPTEPVDPCELMQEILAHETTELDSSRAA